MKAITIVLGLTACSICALAESNAPVILKGIYAGGRPARSYGKGDPIHAVIMRASQVFVEIQNSDGSWSTNENRQLPTAFCLISLLRQGKSRESNPGGKAIAAGHTWLMQSQPKTDPERVATAIALSDY